ncbi:hypothetical protein CCHR01_04882 [Colletotrichum chrysophilum]|uniref:Uncharacterized protein n=1 Tax=Colletotrichum chrysophilum TaxID=1836956 RepID=A0AAD9EM35_9PEZI|nr:hypothetical protein CCHR01_04882 [Colletotrichum chrysophilum]
MGSSEPGLGLVPSHNHTHSVRHMAGQRSPRLQGDLYSSQLAPPPSRRAARIHGHPSPARQHHVDIDLTRPGQPKPTLPSRHKQRSLSTLAGAYRLMCCRSAPSGKSDLSISHGLFHCMYVCTLQ